MAGQQPSQPLPDSHVWPACRVIVLSADESQPFEDDDVEVKQAGEHLEVVYWDDEGAVVFGGVLGQAGSYELVCRSRPRTATLAWSDDRKRLVGRWQQGDEHGTWTVVVERG